MCTQTHALSNPVLTGKGSGAGPTVRTVRSLPGMPSNGIKAKNSGPSWVQNSGSKACIRLVFTRQYLTRNMLFIMLNGKRKFRQCCAPTGNVARGFATFLIMFGVTCYVLRVKCCLVDTRLKTIITQWYTSYLHAFCVSYWHIFQAKSWEQTCHTQRCSKVT